MRTLAPYQRRRSRAFTLLEVLISVAILAGLTATIWGSLSVSFRAKKTLTRLNERYHEGRQVVRRMTRELRMAFLRAQPPEDAREEEPAVITRFQGEREEISFPTTSHIRLRAEGRESDQSEIAYFLGRSDQDSPYERGKTLYRRESRRIDDEPERGGRIWPVVDGVVDFRLEYWDDSKEIGDDAWDDSWDSDDNQLLPARIRITLELARGGEGRAAPIRFVAQAAPKLRRPIQVLNDLRR